MLKIINQKIIRLSHKVLDRDGVPVPYCVRLSLKENSHGNHEKAMAALKRRAKQIGTLECLSKNICPLFGIDRNEPEFQQIIKKVEAKFQPEHEKVRQWLEDHDMQIL